MADRITILPADGTVVVNGVAKTGLTFILAPEISAVQGYEDGTFVVEFKPIEFEVPGFAAQMLKPLNLTTMNGAPFQYALYAFAAAG